LIHDITPPIHEGLAVWPGDTPYTREILLDMRRGDNITLSTMRATLHLGAHADGPNHYGREARGIDRRDLTDYLGACQVVRVEVGRGVRVGPHHLKAEIKTHRVLFRTLTYPDPNAFSTDFAGLGSALIEELARRDVRLVGIDTPSVDTFDSKDLPAHQACLKHDLAILEGLVLDHVPEGVYELIALPLRIVCGDASPVRAILRDLNEGPRA
jgi:arylformamidase